MYNNPPIGGVAAGFGGAALSAPFLGWNAFWVALGAFTLVSAAVAVKRIIPKRQA
ncbi:hypothetical protein IMZ11_00430 [Microtetraspora sp. AC03309]|uniref:hypothetical protein n=1 Tax=Microtetraspora sp. AC03309 TaxID=2779376 RepID=UPI001E62AF39|nr:hypothetical protein [Microtetraspora sp. AC03309]MCC5574105.1 hypothetical protein [Microtetraspora sp. AC03309]